MTARETLDWDLGTKNLRLERDGPIAWCIIDRPSARNALTPSMYFGLKKAVRRLNDSRSNDGIRAMIITGTGDVFAPGGDLGGRMLNQQYAAIDNETMFVSLRTENSEAREGMRAFMEKRPPNWVPGDL